MSKKPTYRQINYSLRPAKAIERKMLCDAFRYLSFIQPVDKYEYIGFGSTYFSDFSLFHKSLNLKSGVGELRYDSKTRRSLRGRITCKRNWNVPESKIMN